MRTQNVTDGRTDNSLLPPWALKFFLTFSGIIYRSISVFWIGTLPASWLFSCSVENHIRRIGRNDHFVNSIHSWNYRYLSVEWQRPIYLRKQLMLHRIKIPDLPQRQPDLPIQILLDDCSYSCKQGKVFTNTTVSHSVLANHRFKQISMNTCEQMLFIVVHFLDSSYTI